MGNVEEKSRGGWGARWGARGEDAADEYRLKDEHLQGITGSWTRDPGPYLLIFPMLNWGRQLNDINVTWTLNPDVIPAVDILRWGLVDLVGVHDWKYLKQSNERFSCIIQDDNIYKFQRNPENIIFKFEWIAILFIISNSISRKKKLNFDSFHVFARSSAFRRRLQNESDLGRFEWPSGWLGGLKRRRIEAQMNK